MNSVCLLLCDLLARARVVALNVCVFNKSTDTFFSAAERERALNTYTKKKVERTIHRRAHNHDNVVLACVAFSVNSNLPLKFAEVRPLRVHVTFIRSHSLPQSAFQRKKFDKQTTTAAIVIVEKYIDFQPHKCETGCPCQRPRSHHWIYCWMWIFWACKKNDFVNLFSYHVQRATCNVQRACT